MHPEIDAGRSAHQLTSDVGDQHLAAVADPVDPRDLVHRWAEEVAVALRCRPSVHRHPNTQGSRGAPLATCQRINGVQGTCDRAVGLVEHRDHPVAGVFEHPTAGGLHRAVHHVVVHLEGRPHRIAVRLPQRRRPDHVGHHEHQRFHTTSPEPIDRNLAVAPPTSPEPRTPAADSLHYRLRAVAGRPHELHDE